MRTKYISVKIVTMDNTSLCGKEACPHFAVRSGTGAYRASCRVFGAPLGTGDRSPAGGLGGDLLRCDECLRAKEL